MAELEPQYASDYDDRTTVAIKSVLVEVGQVLGSYKYKFAVIGGAVPWLLLSESDMPHIGTFDVDLSLRADALGGGEYAQLVESLLKRGYRQREHLARFQLMRTVPAPDEGANIDIIVDFLLLRDAYDVYHSIRNFPGSVDALVAATTPLLEFESARAGYLHISQKFRHPDDFGPTSVRQFIDRPDLLGERTADQWQQDAFGQVDVWLKALGLR